MCCRLQRAIDTACEWSLLFGLDLSPPNCVVMSHTMKHRPILFNYTLAEQPIERMQKFKDLGVLFDGLGLFKGHVSLLTTKK